MNDKVMLYLKPRTGAVTIDLMNPPDNLEELISEALQEDCGGLDRR